MRAVAVHLYAFPFLCINIAGDMLPSVNQAHPPALFVHLVGKHRAVQPCAHDQIVIIHIISNPYGECLFPASSYARLSTSSRSSALEVLPALLFNSLILIKLCIVFHQFERFLTPGFIQFHIILHYAVFHDLTAKQALLVNR